MSTIGNIYLFAIFYKKIKVTDSNSKIEETSYVEWYPKHFKIFSRGYKNIAAIQRGLRLENLFDFLLVSLEAY